MTTWLTDDHGNKCSVEYFGSQEAAQKALDSLENCDNCINCSGCSDCSGCAFLIDKQNLQPQPIAGDAEGGAGIALGQPPVPVIPDIHGLVYAAVSQPKALDMSSWHTCETTHCRAGWVVHLAGDEGRALERFHNTDLAARLIYRASGYDINPARFHDSNADALADMKKLAEGFGPQS